MIFNKPKKIIYIARDKVTAIEVVDAATKKFGKTFEFGWTNATLDLALTETAKKFGSKDYRILVSDDLSYVVRMSIPSTVTREGMRDYILEKLQEKIPDEISEGEWDYRQLKTKVGEERDVITFTLVKNFAKALSQAVAKAGLNIEAIEAETISKTRDANAYIGLALKEDIAGKDEDVLNLQPGSSAPAPAVSAASAPTPTQPEPLVTSKIVPPAPPTERKFSFRVLILLILLILVGILAGGFFYLRSNITPSEPVDSQTENEESIRTEPEVSTEPTPSPTDASGFDMSALSVQIQNGSGTPGEATRVSDLLEPLGITEITTGNASSFGFIDTEVAVKESADAAYEDIENALKESYNITKDTDFLTPDSNFDVVIIVGTRK